MVRFSRRQQTAIVLGAIAELIMTTIALRDSAHRPATQVRGLEAPVGPGLLRTADRPGRLLPGRPTRHQTLTRQICQRCVRVTAPPACQNALQIAAALTRQR